MKLAIFDLDGTLVNSLEDIANAANYSLEKAGCPVHELENYNYFVGDGLNELIHRILPPDKQDKFDEVFNIYKDYYNSHYMVKTRAYDGIIQMLERLTENGVSLAVASNKTDVFTQNVVKHYFGEKIFSVVCGRTESRPVKPDPAILRTIMDKLQANPADCFMIGDTNIDIKTGKNAGIKTIGCLWGFRTLEELNEAGADFIAEKPENIVKFICN
ncbi:MAG: HAD family hydrolase [Oscillospiraceae bacterium]|nr:HAD family hydrolase [Oscillospiraceae bacterium]